MTEPKGGSLLLGKLKALGDRIENVATNVVSGVQTGVSTVGTGVINVAKDIKESVLDGDLDKIRSVHAFQKNQASLAQSGRRKHFSEQELDAADQRAAQVLAKLPPGYFEKEYDPVRHELSQLLESSGQEDMDAIVERLGQCMEVRTKCHTRLQASHTLAALCSQQQGPLPGPSAAPQHHRQHLCRAARLN